MCTNISRDTHDPLQQLGLQERFLPKIQEGLLNGLILVNLLNVSLLNDNWTKIKSFHDD
jgi:hypothetical protein